MARFGTTPCPQIIEKVYGGEIILCSEVADVDYIEGVLHSTCAEGHIHALSDAYVSESVTED